MKSTRKQQAKEKQVIKLKSQAKSLDQLQWRRDTGNPVIDTFTESETQVGGYITIEDYKFDVRMPLRKYIKKFEALAKRYDSAKDSLEIDDETAIDLQEVQNKIVADMIPDFDDESDDYRVDSLLFTQIISFCWEFYRFFGKKSSVVQSEQSGIGKA